MGLHVDGFAGARRLLPARALARMARTGIYLVRGVPRDLQRAARFRATSEGTTLHKVLLQGLREYAAGIWTPEPEDTLTESRRYPMGLPGEAGVARTPSTPGHASSESGKDAGDVGGQR